MAIVPLTKVTFYGAASNKAQVLDRLQSLGCLHLVRLSAEEEIEVVQQAESSLERNALKYLDTCPGKLRSIQGASEDLHQVVQQALDLQKTQRDLEDERDALSKAISQVEPWGEFSLPDLKDLRFWFYQIPIRDLKEFEETDLTWQEVSRDHQNSYVVVISPLEPVDAPGVSVSLDSRPLSELRRRKVEVEDKLEEVHYQRVGLTRWSESLRRDLDLTDDRTQRDVAAFYALDQEEVFALQGWAPQEARATLEEFAIENQLALTIESPRADDEPPTLLENSERLEGGDGLVTFYKTPGYNMWDPSGVVFYSFALFFAMILADAGYAAILGLLLLWKWRSMGASENGRKLRNILRTIVLFSLVYGVIAGSYFGVSPPPESFLGRLRLLDAQDLATMMPLSVGVGIIHIGIANAVTAWRLRGHRGAISALGWIAIMAGGGFAAWGMLDKGDPNVAQMMTQIGTVVFIIGILAVFLFTSDRPFFTWSIKQHVLRIVDGFSGLLRLTNLFGDVLSYLRLFALGLSSAKLAATFNNLGKDAWDSAGLGVILAIAIILLGHFLNLLLSVMSGVVHGLRLNCIEFFNWSLPEEGHPFVPFAKKVRES